MTSYLGYHADRVVVLGWSTVLYCTGVVYILYCYDRVASRDLDLCLGMGVLVSMFSIENKQQIRQ